MDIEMEPVKQFVSILSNLDIEMEPVQTEFVDIQVESSIYMSY